MRNCNVCNKQINPRRLSILPSTATCKSCSTVTRNVGVLNFNTQGDIDNVCVINPDTNKGRNILNQKSVEKSYTNALAYTNTGDNTAIDAMLHVCDA